MQIIIIAFLLLFLSVYEIINFVNMYITKKKYGKKEELKFKYLKESTRNKLNKRLERLDNPFGMNADKYILYKFILTLFGIYYVYVNHVQGVQAIIFIAGMFFLIDIYLYLKEKDIKEIVRKELPVIVDIFQIASTTGIDYDDTILICSKSIKSKWLKKRLERISADYFVTKDKEKLISSIRNLAEIPEIGIFASTLEQENITGRTKEMLESLSQLMFTSVMAHARKENKMSDYKVMIAVFIITVAILSIYMVTYMPEIMSGLKTIF